MACFEIRHEAKQQPDERVPQATIDAAPQPQAWQARLKRLCRHERFSTRIKHDANPVPRSACREKLDFIVIGRCQLYAMQGRLANAATNLREIDLRCFARETSLRASPPRFIVSTSTIDASMSSGPAVTSIAKDEKRTTPSASAAQASIATATTIAPLITQPRNSTTLQRAPKRARNARHTNTTQAIVAIATPATSTIRAAPYGRKPETAIPRAHTPTMPATSKAAHSSTGHSALNASL